MNPPLRPIPSFSASRVASGAKLSFDNVAETVKCGDRSPGVPGNVSGDDITKMAVGKTKGEEGKTHTATQYIVMATCEHVGDSTRVFCWRLDRIRLKLITVGERFLNSIYFYSFHMYHTGFGEHVWTRSEVVNRRRFLTVDTISNWVFTPLVYRFLDCELSLFFVFERTKLPTVMCFLSSELEPESLCPPRPPE